MADDDDDLTLSEPAGRGWKAWLVWLAFLGASIAVLWLLGAEPKLAKPASQVVAVSTIIAVSGTRVT